MDSQKAENTEALSELERALNDTRLNILMANKAFSKLMGHKVKQQAEKAIKESEDKYQTIFENSPLGLIHFSNGGIVTACNENFAKIIGAPREKIIGFDMKKSLVDENMKAAVDAALTVGRGHYEGSYLSVLGGKLTPIKAEFSSIKSDDGNFLGGIGIFEDVTARMQAEEALRESEKKFRDLFESATDSICILDLKGNFREVNRATELLTGYSKEELLKLNVKDIIHSEDLEKAKSYFEILLKEGKYNDYEGRIVSKNGEVRYVHVNSNAVVEDGEVVGSRDIVRDITERKLAQEKLRESQEFLNSIVEYSGDAIITTDKNGDITLWSKSAENLFGYKSKDVLGKNISILYADENRDEVKKWKRTNLTGKTSRNLRSKIINSKGEPRDISLTLSPMLDQNGGQIGTVGVSKDFTDVTKAEKDLHEKIRELEEFHRITVGRELRMIELEKEIEGLKKRLAG